MKTTKKNPARRAVLPTVRLDVHPNVIIANGAESSPIQPLFEHVIRPGRMSGKEITDIITAGLQATGKKVVVSNFDANGAPIK